MVITDDALQFQMEAGALENAHIPKRLDYADDGFENFINHAPGFHVQQRTLMYRCTFAFLLAATLGVAHAVLPLPVLSLSNQNLGLAG